MPVSPEEISELWHTIHRRLFGIVREAFQDCDLPPLSMILLRHVSLEPGVTVNELARRSGTVKSHASRLVEQLVRQGYVEKREDPSDKRLVRLYLTPAATATMAAMEARDRSVWSAVLAEIPPAQQEELVHGLRLLAAALNKRQGEDAL